MISMDVRRAAWLYYINTGRSDGNEASSEPGSYPGNYHAWGNEREFIVKAPSDLSIPGKLESQAITTRLFLGQEDPNFEHINFSR